MPDRLDEMVDERASTLLVDQLARRRVRQELAPRKPLTVKSAVEALSSEEATEVWVVDHILPKGAFVLCVAQHKTGKTTAMLNLAAALLDGSPFLGNPCEVYDRKVLYLNADMPERLLLKYMRNLNIQSDALLTSTVAAREFDIESDEQMANLKEVCLEFDVGIVIIDVWGAVFSGDENDNSQVRVAANRLSALRTEANLDALIVLHHTGWGNSGRARGASAFEGAVDVIWRLQKNESETKTTFKATGRISPTPTVGVAFDERTWRISPTTAY